jgi:amidase
MARTVKDAAYVLNAIAGPDLNDNYTSAIPNCGKVPDYVAACNANALAGARIGIPYNVYDSSDPAVNSAFLSAVSVIEGAGATVVAANFTDPTGGTNETVLLADFINDLANYLAKLTYNPNNVHSLADVRNFTQHFGPEDYPDRDTNVWNDALALGFNNTDYRFWEAYQMQLYAGGDGGLLGALSRNNLDALILPSQQSPDLAAGVGAPIVTVPMGFYPANTTVRTSRRGLVETAPNIP